MQKWLNLDYLKNIRRTYRSQIFNRCPSIFFQILWVSHTIIQNSFNKFHFYVSRIFELVRASGTMLLRKMCVLVLSRELILFEAALCAGGTKFVHQKLHYALGVLSWSDFQNCADGRACNTTKNQNWMLLLQDRARSKDDGQPIATRNHEKGSSYVRFRRHTLRWSWQRSITSTITRQQPSQHRPAAPPAAPVSAKVDLATSSGALTVKTPPGKVRRAR